MKRIDPRIADLLNSEAAYENCDLYTLRLATGEVYRFADYDTDLTIDQKVYVHGKLRFKRGQLKLQGAPSVDSLTVSIYCTLDDTLSEESFMKLCHAGMLDNSVRTLSKAYFDKEVCIGAVDVFSGICEVESAGGICVQLKVKSVIQGLAALIPVRMFAAQAAYSNQNGVVTVSENDIVSMVIPLKPSGNVLLQV